MIVIMSLVVAVGLAFAVSDAAKFRALTHPQVCVVTLPGHKVLCFTLDRLGSSGLRKKIGSAGSQADA